MGPNGVLEQLGKGVAGPNDEVSLTGGPWLPLRLHPDFRPFFLPWRRVCDSVEGGAQKGKGQWF